MLGGTAGHTDRPGVRHSFGWYRFDELDVARLYALLKLRFEVFVLEQACLYPELDGRDQEALHLLATAPADWALRGYLRVLPPSADRPEAWIGRVVVHAEVRKQGLGSDLLREALDGIEECFGSSPVALAAQSHLKRYYEGFGFEPVSEEYLDEGGVPHIDMRRRL